MLTGTRRLGIAAHVLRCSVAALDSRQGVQYRGALKFDYRCDALWEASTLDGYLVPVAEPPAAGARRAWHTRLWTRKQRRSGI